MQFHQHKNKVDVQTNILHTLREASSVGERAFFHSSLQAPPPSEHFRPLIFQKKFLVPKLVLAKPRGLI